MNSKSKIFSSIASGICVVSLVACGGGGDVAAAKTDFSLSPAEFTLKASVGDTTCSAVRGFETTVTIIGGTPPYRIINSWPDNVSVSDTLVTGKNPTFKIVTIGGCVDPLVITVLDYHSRSTIFSVKIEAGDEATTL